MSLDREALHHFVKKPVSTSMVSFLVSTTESVISIRSSKPYSQLSSAYPSPPASPVEETSKSVSLFSFVKGLIRHSRVQTPTLMASLVYLVKLRSILPANSHGVDTTHHRIFLGALILAAKSLNDSSPFNKCWAAYTDGLLTLKEVNTLEREMIGYLGWDLRVTEQDIMNCFAPFLAPIREKIMRTNEERLQASRQLLLPTPVEPLAIRKLAQSNSASSVPSLSSSASTASNLSTSSALTTVVESDPVHDFKPRPLRLKSITNLQYNQRKLQVVNVDPKVEEYSKSKRQSFNVFGNNQPARIIVES
ncbi:unnamed protein product [Kuraishia capsulata CBS 1993]|uniref:Cyclin N-terminal domain-containing protein n=1 Tax=Kuraishia capsulata CBS 1993 TaxID=1382522 RepID=W6MSG5_9ASCO|nr:uncharacterized protein KUCA_T00005739001 [Kuraishia capsulata CBS 1993]CDK29746.1 unnamed protein product [Kuraishia capsulata CBS 1993]